MSDKDPSTLTGLPKKWDNILKKMPEFKETADSSSVEDLKKIIVTCEGNIYTVDKDEEADVKLSAAREMAKDLAVQYRDGRKYQQAKIQYALLLLSGKGVDLNNKDD
jgi:hypothetical protein